MKIIEKILNLSMVIVLFVILIMSLVHSLAGKQYALSVISTAILFCFMFLMLDVGKVKDFWVGGKDFHVSVNEKEKDGSEN